MPCSFAEAVWPGTLGDNAFMDILVVKVTDFKHLKECESPHQHALHRRSHLTLLCCEIWDLARKSDVGDLQWNGGWERGVTLTEWDSLKADFIIDIRPLIFRVSSPAGKQ
jgi:hypothetical protein